MKVRGRLKDIGISFPERKAVITFEVAASPGDCEKYMGKDLSIDFKQYKEHRSLSANAYFYVLVGKIAEKTGRTITYIHNMLISDYGQYEMQEIGGKMQVMVVILSDDIDAMELSTLHLQTTTAVRELDNGNLYRVYRVMRGSHTYNTAEMSRLIDGTVQEARELGIETLTPDAIARMEADWSNR